MLITSLALATVAGLLPKMIGGRPKNQLCALRNKRDFDKPSHYHSCLYQHKFMYF